MVLLIDSASEATIGLVLVSGQRKIQHHFASQNLSENLLVEIKKFCRKQKMNLSDLTKIEIKPDLGHFSKTRTVVATANALAFGLGLPQALIQSVYGSSPNITRPKKRV